MGMNSLDGSMGMMGGIGMANGGLSLGWFRFFVTFSSALPSCPFLHC